MVVDDFGLHFDFITTCVTTEVLSLELLNDMRRWIFVEDEEDVS